MLVPTAFSLSLLTLHPILPAREHLRLRRPDNRALL